jgi:hypothetical protein
VEAAKGGYIKVTYTAGTDATTDDVVIKINLASDWATYWTLDQATNTFYYNNRIAAGDTSKLLIDSLELDESVTKDAYVAFQYDLTINTDSVQVVTNEKGVQTVDSIPTSGDNAWWYATATLDEDGKTIKSVAWTKDAPKKETESPSTSENESETTSEQAST